MTIRNTQVIFCAVSGSLRHSYRGLQEVFILGELSLQDDGKSENINLPIIHYALTYWQQALCKANT